MIMTNMHCNGCKFHAEVSDQAEHDRPELIVLNMFADSDNVTVFMNPEQLDELADAIDKYTLKKLHAELNNVSEGINLVDLANFILAGKISP